MIYIYFPTFPLVFVSHESRNSLLDGWFWFRVSLKTAIFWGLTGAGGSATKLTIAMSLLARGSSPSPNGPLYRAAHFMAAGFPQSEWLKKVHKTATKMEGSVSLITWSQEWQIVTSAVLYWSHRPVLVQHWKELYRVWIPGGGAHLGASWRLASVSSHSMFIFLLGWLLLFGGLHFLAASWNRLTLHLWTCL